MGLLTDEIRAFVGREVTYTAEEEVGRSAIRYFALALGDDNPLFHDDAYATASGYPSVIAHPTMVCESNQFVPGRQRDEAGYIGHSWDLPVTGCRMIRGGNSYTFERPVLPDDRITTTWRIDAIDEKVSSSGKQMLVVSSIATYTDQESTLLATNRETLIYQER